MPLEAVSGDHLARVDADPQRKLVAEELAELLSHRYSRAKRALSVILMGGRRPKRGHDCVTDELLDRAARCLDLCPHSRVEATQQGSRAFRILRGAELRRPHQVSEEDGGKFHSP